MQIQNMRKIIHPLHNVTPRRKNRLILDPQNYHDSESCGGPEVFEKF